MTEALATVTPLAPRRAPAKRKAGRRGFGSTRKLPSGRWQARYTGPDQVSRTAPVTFDTKGDADRWLALTQSEILKAEWKPPTPRGDRIRLDDWAEEYVSTRELTASTRGEYRDLLRRYVLPTLGAMTLDRISRDTVKAWYASLDPSKPTARAHAYQSLVMVMKAALREGHIQVNPCTLERVSKTKRAREIRPASVKELAALVEAMPDWLRAATMLSAWCSLRSGEVTELRRKDLDLAKGVVKVTRGVAWAHNHETRSVDPVIGLPKAGSVRDVTIPGFMVPALQHHLDTFVGPGPEALLFPAPKSGGSLRPTTYSKHFRKAKIVAGRPDLTPHQLRHTGAVLTAQSGATLKELMDRLGHSSPRMALHYQHVADGRQAMLAARLSAMATGELSTLD